MIIPAIKYGVKSTCISCGDFGPSHTCQKCTGCCTCAPCNECMKVTPDICCRCVRCTEHCKCIMCSSCLAFTDNPAYICTTCGMGKSELCGCCGGKIFQNHDINLSALEPGYGELLTNKSSRLISAEIEVCGMATATCELTSTLAQNRCTVVHDGSLPKGGFEINTHPAGGDLFLQLINDIGIGLMKGSAFVDERAGCHIHVDARDFGYTDLAMLCKVYGCTEAALYSLLPQGRRTNKFCKVCGVSYLLAMLNAEKNDITGSKLQAAYRKGIMDTLYGTSNTSYIKSTAQTKSVNNRYRGLNLHSWFHRGTIEFRIPPGMTNPRYISNWGMLLANMLDVCKKPSTEVSFMVATTIKTLISIDNGFTASNLPIINWDNTTANMIKVSQDLLLMLSPCQDTTDWMKTCFKCLQRGIDIPKEYYK